jgi:Lon protease-like protein
MDPLSLSARTITSQLKISTIIMQPTKFPLFPLTAHLMPAGRMALRIFEPRYVRMVKEACATNQGFVMCMLNRQGDRTTNAHIYPIGTYCRVIDFDILDDGLLGITVAGEYLVQLSAIETEDDGLEIAHCEPIVTWQCDTADAKIEPLKLKLKEIFARYPELAALYDNPPFDDPMWLVNRWLELLPVDASTKQQFLQQNNCETFLHYVNDLIK